MPKEQDVAVPRDFSSGKTRAVLWALGAQGAVLCAQSAAGASERASRERSGALPQNHDRRPCPAGCCAAAPGVGAGLTHLPAGTRVALVKGEGGDGGAECMRENCAGPGQPHSLAAYAWAPLWPKARWWI